MQEGRRPQHKWEFLATIVFAFLTLVTVGVLTFLWLSGTVVDELFDNKVSDLLEEPLEAYPDDWTFILLYVIVAYQFMWLVYGLSTLCSTSHGSYLYLCPRFIPLWLYVVYIIGLALFIAHIFLWDNDQTDASLIVVALAFVAFAACAGLSYVSLDKNRHTLEKRGLDRDITFVQVLVQNGIEMMLTWTGIMSVMLLAEVVYVREEMTAEDASTLALGIVAVSVCLLALFGFFFFERFQRYTFAPYLVFGVYLAGVLTRHWEYQWPSTNLILALVTLIVLFLFFIIKLSLTCVKGNVCGRYCGCVPSCHCTGTSCCDCEPVNEDGMAPVYRDTSMRSVARTDDDAIVVSTPNREVLNLPTTFSQPYRVSDTTYGVSPPLGGSSFGSMSTARETLNVTGLSQPWQNINSLTVSGPSGVRPPCACQSPVAQPPNFGYQNAYYEHSFPRPVSTGYNGPIYGRNY